MKPKMNPIIVALDGMKPEEAFEMAELLKGQVGGFKANDLLDSAGAETAIRELKKYGMVMADPKLHDIPNTVANRIRDYAKYEADLVTVMASGGIEMMMEAVGTVEEVFESRGNNPPPTRVIAVTVPTSLSEEDCHLIYGMPVKAKVLSFAKDAYIAGVDMIVCSPQELEFLNKFRYLDSLDRMTPGITPIWATKPGDQKRVTPPSVAIENGASFIVVGRAITKAPKEIGTAVDAAQKILEEVEETREDMETEQEQMD